MYSNKWVGVIHVKHMSKDNNNNKKKQIKLKPGDPCSGKVMDVSFLCGESGKATNVSFLHVNRLSGVAIWGGYQFSYFAFNSQQ